MSKSDRETLFISRFKEQNLPVTRSLAFVICRGAVSPILRDFYITVSVIDPVQLIIKAGLQKKYLMNYC
jgi:hypothetical protein